jgi:hypothetical protein
VVECSTPCWTTSARWATLDRVTEEIEERAERLLAEVPDYVWDGKSLPVPVEDIADTVFRLLIRDEDDMSLAPGAPALGAGDSLSGLLLPGSREIWVNAHEAGQWPGRRRFTISHELGHWCLHRDDHVASIYCRSTSVDPPAERPERPLPEQEADAFAAALLMPASLMREHYTQCRDRFQGQECFFEMCRRFGTSNAAMGRRLQAVI